jgi:CubicO group peptidase (beta-lactamase class C family)
LPDEIDAIVTRTLAATRTAGCAVGIVTPAGVETRGYGLANGETGLPVTADTIFQLASISKAFTATALLGLVDEGLLDLDTPVSVYLPDLVLSDSRARQAITLRHLLSHTSGLYGDYFADFGLGDDVLERAVASFGTVAQRTAPGALWAYANSGYVLAGALLARVCGTPFEAAMRARLLVPLGLTRACYFAHEAVAYPVAVGHQRSVAPAHSLAVVRRYAIPRVGAPAGGLLASVNDLLRFARLHLGGGTLDGAHLLRPETVALMQQPQTPAANFADAWGLGWDIRRLDGVAVIGHAGGSNGFSTRLTLVPERGVAVAILSNGAGDPVGALEAWALRHACGLTARPPRPSALPAAELERFAGRYRSQQDTLDVARHADGLRVVMRLRRQLMHDGREFSPPPLFLRPIGAREFVVVADEPTPERIDFVPDAHGRPRFIRYGGRLAERETDGL